MNNVCQRLARKRIAQPHRLGAGLFEAGTGAGQDREEAQTDGEAEMRQHAGAEPDDKQRRKSDLRNDLQHDE